jgi:hypothetical protein
MLMEGMTETCIGWRFIVLTPVLSGGIYPDDVSTKLAQFSAAPTIPLILKGEGMVDAVGIERLRTIGTTQVTHSIKRQRRTKRGFSDVLTQK